MSAIYSSPFSVPLPAGVRKPIAEQCVGSSFYPGQFDVVDPLPPGFHIMTGAGGSGKTVNSLALQFELLARGKVCVYRCFDEPRGEVLGERASFQNALEGKADLPAPEDGKGVVRGAYFFQPMPYEDYLKTLFATARSLNKDPKSVPVLILDSLTYKLKALKMTSEALGGKSVTFEKGLGEDVILGVQHHSLLAAMAGVALIGTVNSELLPPVEKLRGSCEGIIEVLGIGRISTASRESLRTKHALDLRPQAVEWALSRAKGKPHAEKGESLTQAPGLAKFWDPTYSSIL